jgi:hypothetical protein
MPKGLDTFAAHFASYADHFVLIGGTACELALLQAGIDFRATKDLDIVLSVETLNREFSSHFWAFIKAGDYEHIRFGTEHATQCYRFSKPKALGYPFMLELFARKTALFEPPSDRPIVPVRPDEDISSLSAILMDDDYYQLVQTGRRIIDGLPCLAPESIIPLKAKAFLDLTNKKKAGRQIDSGDVKKHKNDVFRLWVLLTQESRISLPIPVQTDLREFVAQMRAEPTDLKSLGLSASFPTVLESLEQIYRL